MRFWRVLGVVMFVGALTPALAVVNISGKWTGRGEQGPDWVFKFKVDGSKVTGTMQGADGVERPINDGKLEGDALSFTVNSEWQGQAIKLVMKGKVSGEKIELRVDTEDGAWGTDLVLTRSTQ